MKTFVTGQRVEIFMLSRLAGNSGEVDRPLSLSRFRHRDLKVTCLAIVLGLALVAAGRQIDVQQRPLAGCLECRLAVGLSKDDFHLRDERPAGAFGELELEGVTLPFLFQPGALGRPNASAHIADPVCLLNEESGLRDFLLIQSRVAFLLGNGLPARLLPRLLVIRVFTCLE